MESVVAQIAAQFEGRHVLVTGAAGFIGRRLVSALARAGAQVSIIEASSADLSPLNALLSHYAPNQSVIQSYLVDIRNKTDLEQVVTACRPEYVFHLAAVGVNQPFLPLELALSVNLEGSINLFQACFESGNPVRLVHTGTPYEYGDQAREPYPINHYAASKAAAFAIARMYHRTQNWPIVTVRPFQVYGPGQTSRALIPSAIRAVLAGRPFPMTGGEQERDLVFVDDVLSGYLLAANRGVAGSSYDLGWGQPVALKEVIGRLFVLMEAKSQPKFGALPYRPGEVLRLQANPQPAAVDLGWRPVVGLDQGLLLTIESFQLDNLTASM